MSSEKALIAAIVDAPTVPGPWCAYRDWLIERGDPRGEWIRAALEADDGVSRRRPVDDEELMTPRLYAQSHLLRVGWWRGFIHSAGLCGAMDDPPTHETLDALFADPHAALLSSLAIVHPITATVPLWEAVVANERPRLRSLRAENLGSGVAELACKLPDLEHLTLGGMFVASRRIPFESSAAPAARLVHPNLRELETAPTSSPALITGDFELPRLAALGWDSYEGYDARDPIADPPGYQLFTSSRSILHRPPPHLAELNLIGLIQRVRAQSITAGCELGLLEACAVLAQLRVLRLRCFDASRALFELRDRAPAFRHLETIEIDGHAELPRDRADALRTELERALPTTKLEVRWANLVQREKGQAFAPTGADSRNDAGRVDALSRWVAGVREP